MKCTKCGFVSFDYLEACKKCGTDLSSVRQELNLFDFRPEVPAFVAKAIKALMNPLVPQPEETVPEEASEIVLDEIPELDLTAQTSTEDGELTLQLLDEEDGEELSIPEAETESVPTAPLEDVEGDELVLDLGALEEEEVSQNAEPALPQGDLAVEEAPSDEAPGEDEVVYELAEEEQLADESLDQLRRELESVDALMGRIEEPAQAEEDEDTVVVLEEDDQGVAVQEFVLESMEDQETSPTEEEPLELDLDLGEFDESPADELPDQDDAEARSKEQGDETWEEGGLILELEDGLILEPDDEDEADK
ncbi:hypothetical protein SAMN02746041_02250 [Desulfacinum hydrothermale DSM 13146]|uniref:Uncharacterized protein n=1 Tax=Desulfacinum hydrothermale DSM 13146 TaxID=1121390 RepID=A0A1W1XMX8_9BACT|nr:hypothetical protein [Desulfacinum hydrothermale]SMC25214.1 hypothetical protein SAMN02746041_02250 [Desulfacinum hydrothermale DSM 13146]